jgi:hypothetical protein
MKQKKYKKIETMAGRRRNADRWQAQELGVIEPQQQKCAAAATDTESRKGCRYTFFGIETKEYLGFEGGFKSRQGEPALTYANQEEKVLLASLARERVVIWASRSLQRARQTAPVGSTGERTVSGWGPTGQTHASNNIQHISCTLL